jgi:hypothetical protein
VRIYRTIPSIWGFGIAHHPGGWSVQFAWWVVTTEPY